MNIKVVLGILFFAIFTIDVHALDKVDVTLNKCVDGDTAYFNYQGEVLKARFLAIDTPEISKEVEIYGEEAKLFTCEELSKAKKIVLEYDENSDKFDKYNRHLVWVFVDDRLLQSLIVRNGYAEVAYLYGNYKYTDGLKADEEYARNIKVGIWDVETNQLVNMFAKVITIVIFVIAIYKLIKRELKKKKII